VSAPVASESSLREHLATWIAGPRRARTILVRAQPIWSGDAVLTVRDERVRIAEGVSGLAALDAMRSTPTDQLVAVLTELTAAELGTAVVLDAEKQRVTDLDEWNPVPALFAARSSQIPPRVRELGSWVPRVLTSWRRDRGYPPAPGGVVSRRHVVGSLLVALLGLDRIEDLELSTALTPLDDPVVRARLADLDEIERRALIAAAATEIHQYFGMALQAAIAPGAVSPIAVGLVVGDLWASGTVAPDPATAAARARAEHYVGPSPSAAAAQNYGAAARLVMQRWLASADRHAREVLEQAEAICGDLAWTDEAARSKVLLGGLSARIEAFAYAVHAAATTPSTKASVAADSALAAIDEHMLRVFFEDSRATAQMATRLTRWLHAPDHQAQGLEAALAAYSADGAWAERALGDLWDGDRDAHLAAAYNLLAHAVQLQRREQDAAAATHLTGAVIPTGAVVPVERMLAEVVVPLSAASRILLIVLDGMSVPTAVELASGLDSLGWTEVVPENTRRREVAIAMLPTITEYSRTSLFAGEPLSGNLQTEKSRFASAVNGVLFHKDDLRADAGHALPRAVTEAIADPGRKIVAAVLNTIDDALAGADVDALRWTTHSIAHFEALLAAASDAGRIVVLTSDHGHIVERGSELRSTPHASARWRDASGEPPRDDEVLVSGARVLAPGGKAILAVSDGLRYAAKRPGYHGGAALAELTVPIIVAKPRGAASPTGWIEAPPQEPVWWNEPVQADAPIEAAASTAKARAKQKKLSEPAAPTLFDGTEASTEQSILAIPASLGDELLASQAYIRRRRLAGRHPVEDRVTLAVIACLVAGSGRAHRDTLAAAVGVPSYTFNGVLTALRRVLNVDGYPVIDVDSDQETVTLDSVLLREQFKLGSA